jgi:hypothetical protein
MRENLHRLRTTRVRKRDGHWKDEVKMERCQNREVIEEIANQIKEFREIRHREELESNFRTSKKRESDK